MAGFDEGSGPALYWCDYLATLHHMNICGTGYGARGGQGQQRCCMHARVLARWLDERARFSPPSPPPRAHAGSYFVLSMFDKLWHPDVTEAEALEMMRKGVAEVKSRLVVAPPKYLVKVIDKDGIRTLTEL